jgi:hypothetical protein
MRRFVRFAVFAVAVLLSGAVGAAMLEAIGPQAQIRVIEGGWGNARASDIEQVLRSAARELLQYFPQRTDRFLVKHVQGNPRVLYERGPQGEYVVHLSATDRRWAQYAYQFSHELCHVLARYELRPAMGTLSYQWFEEALCETASLFVLRRLAVTWDVDPPYPHWREYAPAFGDYAHALLAEPHRQAPDEPLAVWYVARRETLANDPYLRSQNEVVATRLLPLFEAQPNAWAVLDCLNTRAMRHAHDLNEYLRSWHQAARSEHCPFLAQLLALFGVSADQAVLSEDAPAEPLPSRS